MSSLSRIARARIAVGVGLVGVVGLAAGCGSSTADADIAAGEVAFATCAGCHTMEAFGSTGSNQVNPDGSVNDAAGPNLDDAFRAARQVGMSEEQFAGVVRRWIRIAQPPMPRDIVTGEDAENVAAYIASVAGRDSESPVRAAGPETPEAPSPPRQEINPSPPFFPFAGEED
jgi:mono/diheme cytochrome c family protein